MFEEALVCLKQALTLLGRDRRLTASISQNIGAVYNEMELFPEALDYHQQAADQYGVCPHIALWLVAMVVLLY